MEKRLLSRVLSLGVGAVLSKFTVFFLMPLYTAALPPASFGVVDILLGTAALLIPLAAFGAPDAIFRFVAGGESERSVMRAAVRLLLLGALCLALLFPFLLFFRVVRPFLHYLFFYVLSAVFHSTLAHLVRARGKYGFYAVQQVFCTLMSATLAYYFLIVRGAGVKGYLLAVLLSDVGTGLLLLLFLILDKEVIGEKTERELLRPVLRFALPLIPTAALWWLLGGAQRYLLLFFCGESATGLYAAALRLPALLSFASGIFLEAWHFTAIRTEKSEQAQSFGKIYGLLLPVLILFSLALIVGSPHLVRHLLAPDFRSAAALVPLLSIAALFGALAQFLSSIYSVALRSGTVLMSSLVAAAVSVTAGLLLIPRFGARGAAWSFVLASFALFFLRALLARRILAFEQHGVKFAFSLAVLFLGVWYSQRTGEGVWIFMFALLPFVRECVDGVCLLWNYSKKALYGIKKQGGALRYGKNQKKFAKKQK